MLLVILKSHPNSPGIEANASPEVHAEVDHTESMFIEVFFQAVRKCNFLAKLVDNFATVTIHICRNEMESLSKSRSCKVFQMAQLQESDQVVDVV